MEYEKPTDDLEMDESLEAGDDRVLRDDFETTASELEENEEEYSSEEAEVINVKDKVRPSDQHSLEVRRAIEDHLERIRLRKELDYLFDEDFTSEEQGDSQGK